MNQEQKLNPSTLGPVTTFVSSLLNSTGNYIETAMLFVHYNNKLPSRILMESINPKEALKWIKENLSNQNLAYFEANEYNNEFSYGEITISVNRSIIFSIDFKYETVYCYYDKNLEEIVLTYLKALSKFQEKIPKHKPCIYILLAVQSGFDTKRLYITDTKIKLKENYNDDFIAVNNTIIKRLSAKNDKGIVLLHGKPGTGKTSYIRFLMARLRTKKKIIFLPPNLTSSVTGPALIGTLVQNPNSIFVIEDAENIILDRERHENGAISAILNLADGLLSDCLNIQIICSFNTELSRIDKALLRKGRLIARYEFNELAVNKAQALSDKLGFDSVITQPMTLASIYNQNTEEYHQIKKLNQIGFVA